MCVGGSRAIWILGGYFSEHFLPTVNFRITSVVTQNCCYMSIVEGSDCVFKILLCNQVRAIRAQASKVCCRRPNECYCAMLRIALEVTCVPGVFPLSVNSIAKGLLILNCTHRHCRRGSAIVPKATCPISQLWPIALSTSTSSSRLPRQTLIDWTKVLRRRTPGLYPFPSLRQSFGVWERVRRRRMFAAIFFALRGTDTGQRGN